MYRQHRRLKILHIVYCASFTRYLSVSILIDRDGNVALKLLFAYFHGWREQLTKEMVYTRLLERSKYLKKVYRDRFSSPMIPFRSSFLQIPGTNIVTYMQHRCPLETLQIIFNLFLAPFPVFLSKFWVLVLLPALRQATPRLH